MPPALRLVAALAFTHTHMHPCQPLSSPASTPCQVLPVLFAVLRGSSDDALREFILEQLTQLTRVVRAHIRRFLPDKLALVQECWGDPRIAGHCLRVSGKKAGGCRAASTEHAPCACGRQRRP